MGIFFGGWWLGWGRWADIHLSFVIGADSRNDLFDNTGLGVGVVLNRSPLFPGQVELGPRIEITIRSIDTEPVAEHQHTFDFRAAV